MMRTDNYIVGVLIGLLMPFLGFFGFYEYKFSLFTVQEFLELLNQQKSVLSAMISISLLINGAVLTYFFKSKKTKRLKEYFLRLVFTQSLPLRVNGFYK